MNCTGFEQYILRDSADELPARQKTKLQRHMEHCAACRSFSRDLTALHRTLKVDAPDAPDTVVKAILMEAGRQPIRARSNFLRLSRAVIALAAGLMICVGFWHSFRGLHPAASRNQVTGNSHITEVSDILFAITAPELWLDQWGDSRPADGNIEALAKQILITQGLYVDFQEETDEQANSHEALQPTTLLWHNSPEPLA